MDFTTRAFAVGTVDGTWSRRIEVLDVGAPGDDEVVVRVAASGINFKDGLASSPTGRVARIDPLVPGVDLAGDVVASSRRDVPVGSRVLVHGYDLGVARHGGFAGLARVPADWGVPMQIGRAHV